MKNYRWRKSQALSSPPTISHDAPCFPVHLEAVEERSWSPQRFSCRDELYFVLNRYRKQHIYKAEKTDSC